MEPEKFSSVASFSWGPLPHSTLLLGEIFSSKDTLAWRLLNISLQTYIKYTNSLSYPATLGEK
jgi:hypothetical protein